MVKPNVYQQLAAIGRLHYLSNLIQTLCRGSICCETTYSVVYRVLVLLQSVGDIVGHNSSIVGDCKVCILVRLGLGLQEDGQFAEGGLQLLLEELVSGLREEGLLLEDGPDAHRLLKHDDGSGQVHPKVDHLPCSTTNLQIKQRR